MEEEQPQLDAVVIAVERQEDGRVKTAIQVTGDVRPTEVEGIVRIAFHNYTAGSAL